MQENRDDDWVPKDVDALLREMQSRIPGMRIAYKDDDPSTIWWGHRVVHRVAGWFVPDYATRFTTVLYPVIYLPAGSTRGPLGAHWFETLRHELVHLEDTRNHPIWMPLSYVAVFPIGLTMRAWWELRGYAQSMLDYYERHGIVRESYRERVAKLFYDRSYLFMVWPRGAARRMIWQTADRIEAGEIRGLDGRPQFFRDFVRPIFSLGRVPHSPQTGAK